MADRIINANILKSKPKINFSANNKIVGIEWEEKETTLENRVVGNSVEIIPYTKGSNRDNYTFRLTDADYNPVNYKLGYYDRQSTSTQIERTLKADINIEIKDYLTIKNIDVLFESTTDSWFSTFESLDHISKWKNSTFVESILYKDGIVNIKIKGPIIYVKDTNQTPNYYMYSKKIIINVVADVVVSKSAHKNLPQTKMKSSIVLNSNELMQTDTTINGISIGQHIANDILSQYKNGKATMTCTVNISDGTPLFVVGEIAKVYGFDGKSVSRNRDGTDKRFKITSAEWRWAGQETQNLEMVEVIE